MREEAASEATQADKTDGGEDDNKQTKLKLKRSSHKKKQKSSSSKKVKLPDDNLDEFFA